MQLFEAKTFCSRHFALPCGYSCRFSSECTHWVVTVHLVCAEHWAPGTTMHSRCSELADGSVQFSRSIMSNSLRPRGLQHTRLPCPAPTQVWACSYSCPLNRWCHPTISSSVVPFSSCLQSFPASGSFQMSQLVLPVRWPNYWSFNFSISPSNEYSGLISFRMVWLDLLAVQGTLKSLLQHHSSKASILWCSAFFTL